MGMVDTGARASMIIYDRVEYALNWMDLVITGEQFRNVLIKSEGLNRDRINPNYVLYVVFSISVNDVVHNVIVKLTFRL